MQKRRPVSEAPQGASLIATTVANLLAALASLWRDRPSWLFRVSLIVGITLWIYSPSLRGDFIWDDQWYIQIDPLIKDPNGLWKFWFQPGAWVEYYPIQETVTWLQWQFWGNDTLGYHLTNVFLHIVNALLVWKLLGKFRLRFAWLGGLIFAVHPVQVDSVAYICELKNTLSLPFFLVAMCAWIDYDDTHAARDFHRSLSFFILALLCKISMAPFAAVILLYAWWKRGSIQWRDVKGSLVFLAVAMAFAYLTIWSAQVYDKALSTPTGNIPLTGPLSRFDAAGLTAAVYFSRCFVPVDFMLVYSQWALHPHALIQYLPWVVLLGVSALLWWKRRSWGRHVILGLGFFLIFLLPFLGFLGVSYMDFTWVMDHFLYIPVIGLIGLFVAAIGDIDARFPAWSRSLGVGALAGLFALMAWASHALAGLYISELVLWNHILERNPTVWIAHANLGCKFLELERFSDAIVQEKLTIALRPTAPDGYYNMALALDKSGRHAEAKAYFQKSLEYDPNSAKTFLDLGELVRRSGNLPGAETLFRQGLKIAPDDASLNVDLAGILYDSGRVAEAVALYQHVADHNPDLAQVQYNLGNALLKMGNLSAAADHLQSAVTLDPTIAAAHENFGGALAQLGRLDEAIVQFQAALQIKPNLIAARSNLALALAQTGHLSEAIDQFQQVLVADPNNANARQSLAKLQQYQIQHPPAH